MENDEFIPLADWARQNGLDTSFARAKARRGGFQTAKKVGRDWLISKNEKNRDHRKKNQEDNKMEDLRNYIAEHYDGSYWKQITDLYNRDGRAWQLMQFEERVSYDGNDYDVVIIEKYNLDPEDIECVESSEEVYFESVKM